MNNVGKVIELTYTVKDIRRPLIKAAMRSIVLTFVYVLIVLFISYVAASHFITLELSPSFRLGALAFLIVAPLLTVLNNLALCEWRARQKAALTGTSILEITDKGITSSEQYKTVTFGWPAYKRAIEFQDRFELVSGGNRGLLLPKRCFDSAQQTDNFRRIVQAGIGRQIEKR